LKDLVKEDDFAGVQDIGRRETQEDAYAFTRIPVGSGDENALLLVLADGVGGHAAGEVASGVAVHTFCQSFSGHGGGTRERFEVALMDSNELIADRIRESGGSLDGMGTTLVSLYVQGWSAQWISVGDSLLYLFRDEKVMLLNQLHERPHDGSPGSGGITSALAGIPIPLIDCPSDPLALQEHDVFVVASDGIAPLGVDGVAKILRKSRSSTAQEQARRLVDATLELQIDNQDNVTVTVVKVPAENEGRSTPDLNGG